MINSINKKINKDARENLIKMLLTNCSNRSAKFHIKYSKTG